MKPKLIFCLALILSGALLGCSTTKQLVGNDKPPVVLGQADVHRNGKTDRLYLIWTGGKHWLDEEPSCRTGEKYSGKFVFRVERNDGKTVDTSFDSLGGDMPNYFFAHSGIQPIFVDDYNNDGQPDFNILLSHATWRMDECHLFTILPPGKIERLKVEYPKNKAVSGLAIDNRDGISTDEFTLTPKGFYYFSHIMPPREDVLTFLDWQESENAFHYRAERIQIR